MPKNGYHILTNLENPTKEISIEALHSKIICFLLYVFKLLKRLYPAEMQDVNIALTITIPYINWYIFPNSFIIWIIGNSNSEI